MSASRGMRGGVGGGGGSKASSIPRDPLGGEMQLPRTASLLFHFWWFSAKSTVTSPI